MSNRSIRVPDARFSCRSCGRCCTMWSVTVGANKVETLREHDWTHVGAGDPFEASPGTDDAFRIRMVGGRCFFLDADNRCRIHSELGYEAKPEGCKAFPLHFTEVAGVNYGRLSFYCPTVRANSGKKLRDQMRWAQAVLKTAGDVARQAPLTLSEDVELTLREVEGIEAQLIHWMEQDKYSVAERLAAGAGLLRQLAGEVGSKGKRCISTGLAEAHRAGLPHFADKGQLGGNAAQAGPLFSLFLGADCAPSKWARIGRFFSVRLFAIGMAPLTSHVLASKASRGQLRRVSFDPPRVNDALLTRYFLHKMRGRRHLAAQLSLLAGHNLLVAAYGVIHLLCRLKAAAAGRTQPNEEDVAAAVEATDLLVVEHTTLGHKPMFATLVASILEQSDLCAAVLARCGRV